MTRLVEKIHTQHLAAVELAVVFYGGRCEIRLHSDPKGALAVTDVVGSSTTIRVRTSYRDGSISTEAETLTEVR